MCKRVKKYLKEEPLLRKMLLAIVCSSLVVAAVVFILQFCMLQKIYVQHNNLNKQLVGSFTKLYPKQETEIVKTVLDNKKIEDIKYGSDILKKYGYDSDVNIWNDDTFNKNVQKLILYNVVAVIFLLLVILIIFRYCSICFISRLDKVSVALDSIMEGKYIFETVNNEEGILARLTSQFYQMSRRIDLTMQKLNKEKESVKVLVTDISHQLKTPIAAIKLYNSLLMEEEDMREPESYEFLATISQETTKLEWLTATLIKVSRLEIGMIELKASSNSVMDIVCKAVEGVYAKALNKNIEINIENSIGYIVFCDLKWTKEAVINVLENAVKYTPKNGKIDIRVSDTNFFVRVDIKDNGIGIPKKDYNNVFKRFFRGSLKQVQEAEGSGIGLYLTRKILEEQGGSIMVNSELGHGTVFSLFLQKCK